MANSLLSNSTIDRATPPRPDGPVSGRVTLYREDCPEGRIFEGHEVFDMTRDGWVDEPKWRVVDPNVVPAGPGLEERVASLEQIVRDQALQIAQLQAKPKTRAKG